LLKTKGNGKLGSYLSEKKEGKGCQSPNPDWKKPRRITPSREEGRKPTVKHREKTKGKGGFVRDSGNTFVKRRWQKRGGKPHGLTENTKRKLKHLPPCATLFGRTQPRRAGETIKKKKKRKGRK